MSFPDISPQKETTTLLQAPSKEASSLSRSLACPSPPSSDSTRVLLNVAYRTEDSREKLSLVLSSCPLRITIPKIALQEWFRCGSIQRQVGRLDGLWRLLALLGDTVFIPQKNSLLTASMCHSLGSLCRKHGAFGLEVNHRPPLSLAQLLLRLCL